LPSLYCRNQTVLKNWRTTLGVYRSGTSASRWPPSIHLDLENPSQHARGGPPYSRYQVAGSGWQLTFAKYDWRSRDAQNERLPGRQGRHGVRSSRLACRIHDSVFVSIALAKDDTAIVFGEDVAFGGVFRCTMVSYSSFLQYSILICLTLVGLGRGVWWAMRPVSVSPMTQPSYQVGSVSSIHLYQSRVSQASELVWPQWAKQPSRRSSSPIIYTLPLTKYALPSFIITSEFFDKLLPACE
jgi:hypothetical protein